MARFEAEGKKLSPEEKAKRDEHPFDAYARLKAEAPTGQFPKGVDNFRWRYPRPVLRRAGAELLHVPPAHSQRHPRRTGSSRGVADLAERYGGGYAHVTTRANLQIREIAAAERPAAGRGVWPISASPPKGSGADNIRNVTGSPTAGIDPQELLDTRPYARDWHHHILNDRALYGLPRKFNVAFDGGGAIPVLEETNDIAFTAVTVAEGAAVEPGVWFRLGARRHHRPQGLRARHRRAA